MRTCVYLRPTEASLSHSRSRVKANLVGNDNKTYQVQTGKKAVPHGTGSMK